MNPFARALGLLAAVVALAGCAAKPPAGVEVLRYASPYSPNHPFSRADKVWMKWVERESGGRVRVQPFWGGALVSGDQNVIELRHGVADVSLITPIYQKGGMQAVKAQDGFYGGVRSIEDQIAVYRCLSATFPVFGEELAGVRVLAVQGGSLPHILTRSKPVHTLADLKGLRLRAPVELVPVLQQLGVDVVTMPMGEVYSALSKGVIDGVVAPYDTLKSLHFNEVARYMTLLQTPRGGYPGRAISQARWEALPPDLQALLTRSTAVWEKAMADEIRKAEAGGEAFGRTRGITYIPIDPAEQARFDAIYNATAEHEARELSRYGVDGPAILSQAQAFLAPGPNRGRCAHRSGA